MGPRFQSPNSFPRVSSRPLYTTDTESSIILFPNLSVSGRLKQSKTVDIEAIDSQLRSIDQSPDKLGENQAEWLGQGWDAVMIGKPKDPRIYQLDWYIMNGDESWNFFLGESQTLLEDRPLVKIDEYIYIYIIHTHTHVYMYICIYVYMYICI